MKDVEIKKRIRTIIEILYSGNASKLARKIGVTPAHLTVMLGSDQKGVSPVFYRAFPKINVNLNWLVTGKGEMLNRELDSGSLSDCEDKLSKLEFYIEQLERLNKER